jgi:hypothetical protein
MANTALNQTDGATCSVSGGTVFTATADTDSACRGYDARYTGKFVFEATHTGTNDNNGDFVGIAGPGAQMGPAPTALQSVGSFAGSAQCGLAIYKLGSVFINGTSAAAGPPFNKASAAVMLCVDLTNKKAWAIQGGTVYPSGGDPATNTGGWDISAIVNAGIFPCVGLTVGSTNAGVITCNFGGSSFVNTVPVGFTAGWPANAADSQFDPAACGFTEFPVSASSGTFPLKTSGNGRVVGFLFYTEKGSNAAASTISTVTDTAGLTWNKRKQFGYNDGNGGNIELWWAKAPNQLTGVTVTVTLTGATDHGVIYRFGLTLLDTSTGAFGNFYGAGAGLSGGITPSSPFDTNAAVPATAHGASTSPSLTGVSTDSAKSMVIAICGDPVASEGTADTTHGFSALGGFNSHAGGIDWADVFLQARYTQAALSAQTISGGTITSTDWGMLADAFAVSGLPGVVRNMAVVIG